MLREASCRLEECLPESYCTNSATPRLSQPGNSSGSISCSTESVDAGGADCSGSGSLLYLDPAASMASSSGVLTDCCYFILYLGDKPPPSTNPFDDDPDLDADAEAAEASSFAPAATISSSPKPQQRVMSLRSRKRRIYGICRRDPAGSPHCVVLLSAVPCFGLLRHQFMSLTSAFFARPPGNPLDYSPRDDGDFRAFLLAAANPTTGILHREVMTQVRLCSCVGVGVGRCAFVHTTLDRSARLLIPREASRSH